MKTLTLITLFIGTSLAQTAPTAKVDSPKLPQPISKETLLQLQNIDLREKPLIDLINQLADKVLSDTRKERFDLLQVECKKFNLDLTKGECIVDPKTSTISSKEKIEAKTSQAPEDTPLSKSAEAKK